MKEIRFGTKMYRKLLPDSLIFLFMAVLLILPANAALQQAGPPSAANGFPVWYQDTNKLGLEQCLDNNGYCILPPLETFGGVVTYDPAQPVSFPGNFPSESFYWIVDSERLTVGPNGGGRAILRLALEGAFATVNPLGAPAPGQQVTFLRVNLKKMGGLKPNSIFKVTHPFGTFTFSTDKNGNTIPGLGKQAYRAEDGCAAAPCDFTILLPAPTTSIGPFLTWTGLPAGGLVDPATGNHNIGDGVTFHEVVGSPLTDPVTGLPQNIFRIEGPDIGGTGKNSIETKLFTVSGKIVTPVLTTINVVPSKAAVVTGNTQAFAISALDQFKDPIIPASVTWTSSNTTVGAIDPNGVFTASLPGTTTITSTSGTVSGTAAVTVIPPGPELTTINVIPAAATVVVRTGQVFTAETLDQFGSPFQATVTWGSSDPAVGTIDQATGAFTAAATGTTTITAASGTVSGSAAVRVTVAEPVLTFIDVAPANPSIAVGGTQTFTASTLDQFGSPYPAAVTWSSSSPWVGAIDPAGAFKTVGAGTATITATSGTVSGTATLTVTTPALKAAGPISPANGFPLWYEDVSNLALEPCLAGPDGLADPLCVLPTIPPLEPNYDPAQLIVFPTNFPGESFYWIADSEPLDVGPNRQDPALAGKAVLRMALEGTFATGSPAAGEQITFLRVNFKKTGGLVPNSSYTVTYPFGTFTITTDASGNTNLGLAGQAYRTEDGCGASPCDFTLLLPAPTTGIGLFLKAVSPVPPAGYAGDPNILQTITSGSNGNFMRIDGPSIGGPGIDTIQTDQWAVAGKIVQPALTTMSVTPLSATTVVGSAQAFTASGIDQFGNPIPVTATWSSSDPAVGTIDPATGVFTASGSGLATITATSGTASGKATVAVVLPSMKPGILNATGITAPGGVIWISDALGGHTWVIDRLYGFCRLDQAGGFFTINQSTCTAAAVSPGLPAQPTFDAATNSVYVPDSSPTSQGIWRFTLDPATATVGSAVLLAPNQNLGSLRPTATALGPDGKLYVGFLNTGEIKRLTNPSSAAQAVEAFGTSSDGLGVKGLAFAGNHLYLAENSAVTLIGQAGGIASLSSILSTAPTAITSDGANVLFVADTPMPAGISNILRMNATTGFRDLYTNAGVMPDGTIKPFRFVSGLSLDTVTTRLFVADDPGTGVLQGNIWMVPEALAQYCENPVNKDLPCKGNRI